MSFRMRGRADRAARNAAIWLLIFSTSSSAIVFGAPSRREARRTKRNPCCPQPVADATCNECNSCHTVDAIKPPTTAPPNSGSSASASEPSEFPVKAPVAPTPAPPAADASNSLTPQNNSAPIIVPPARSSLEDRGPIVVTNEAPPAPAARESEPKPTSSSLFPETRSKIEKSAAIEVEAEATSPSIENSAPPAIEPPQPAGGGSRYREYLDRYFDRKKPSSNPRSSEERSPPPALESKPTDMPSLEETPTLTPAKPAKEYNDPFRPTSYRSSHQRTWRDPSGEHRMKARFLGFDERGMARMEREDGRFTRIPLANLSLEDQQFIELLAIRDAPPQQVIATRPKGR